ncbi:short-chain collagen C4 [Magallana gigas]|uniref:short-chain collagen C4 n=1 Tax=Magallana gigas TaxID=29159 RepID=UPI00333E79C2
MVVWVFIVHLFLQVIAEKRILLDDPAYLQSQIHALERKMEDVVARNTDLTAKYTDLSVKYNTLLTKSNGGGIFVRWGRKDCPGINTELVYSGFAGGSWPQHTGAAAEFVCLPRDPDLTTKFTSSYAFMYGSEYDASSTEFGHDNGDDLPCSVCRSTVQSSVLMIPGKSSCYDGWSMQYHGDLVAGAVVHKAATQYICLDEHPEALIAGQRNDDGKFFYPVKAVCGALACPPYHNDRYLTCVVCTK